MRFFARLIVNDVVEGAAVAIGILRPELQLGFGFITGRRGEDGGFEIPYLVVFIDDEVAVSITDGFTS
ncbi:MAG TPA: hypothetical protein VN761_02460, partial [Candidatus Polarisedimenticolia bacterium]|nr:hypothetical protein [Candidatus Polarisedimenticolia bacterium]